MDARMDTVTSDAMTELVDTRQDALVRRRKVKRVSFIPAVSEKYESLNYELCENTLLKEEERSYAFSKIAWQRNISRWVVCFLIGFFTALLGLLVHVVVDFGTSVKFNYLRTQLAASVDSGEKQFLSPVVVWILTNVFFTSIAAALCIFVAGPVAAGSGISQIKCFLNGVKIPGVLRFSTFISKIVGVMASVIGGLAVGKEGPMIHAGAAIAGGVSQGRSITFALDLKVFEYFRSDREKRDFVSAGAAAGVAAAFNAPIGGVLFSMEEGCSFWSQPLTWRTFFCSMSCYFFLNFFLSAAGGHFGALSWSGLANFGKAPDISLHIIELPIFIILGIIGGFSGILFNECNKRLSVFRMHYVKNRFHQLVEAMAVALCSAVVSFLLIIYLSSCHHASAVQADKGVQLFCKDGEYNVMAFIFFQSPESAVQSLFQSPTGTFSVSSLLLFVPVYWLLACWTYGLMVPSGIFVPVLLVGACWGRVCGKGLLYLFPSYGALFSPAKYAIIGAGAQLGGVIRMTVSLCVILMESVQSLSIGLPLMVAVVVAKLLADWFNEGLYDMHIGLAEVPLLDWEPPSMASTVAARQVMSSPVQIVRVRDRVGRIVEVLKSNLHHGFPVVSDYALVDEQGSYDIENVWHPSESFGKLEGFITREQLIVILYKREFLRRPPSVMTDYSAEPIHALNLKDFREPYPRYRTQFERLEFDREEAALWVDLKPYMDPAPYIATEGASLRKLFSLFRQLGLRHVVVVSREHRVLGIVTRKDVARYKEELVTNERRYRIREMYISSRL